MVCLVYSRGVEGNRTITAAVENLPWERFKVPDTLDDSVPDGGCGRGCSINPTRAPFHTDCSPWPGLEAWSLEVRPGQGGGDG